MLHYIVCCLKLQFILRLNHMVHMVSQPTQTITKFMFVTSQTIHYLTTQSELQSAFFRLWYGFIGKKRMGYTLIHQTRQNISIVIVRHLSVQCELNFKCGLRTNILYFFVKFEYLYDCITVPPGQQESGGWPNPT